MYMYKSKMHVSMQLLVLSKNLLQLCLSRVKCEIFINKCSTCFGLP